MDATRNTALDLNEAAFASVNYYSDDDGGCSSGCKGDKDGPLRLDDINIDIDIDIDIDIEQEQPQKRSQPFVPRKDTSSPSLLSNYRSRRGCYNNGMGKHYKYLKRGGKERRGSPTELCRSLLLLFVAIGILATAIWSIVRVAFSQNLPEATPGPIFSIISQSNHDKNTGFDVPFANRHNLHFDGILFVTDDEKQEQNETLAPLSFHAYAKTLDPVTELCFSPGESNTTKEIILTTSAPELLNEPKVHSDPSAAMASEIAVLSILLQSNGEIWLPQNTLEHIEVSVETGESTSELPLSWVETGGADVLDLNLGRRITKNIYGSGDRFVLRITTNAIALFRNDDRELLGLWRNPTNRALMGSWESVPLYAQIWFREPRSSMVAYAQNELLD